MGEYLCIKGYSPSYEVECELKIYPNDYVEMIAFDEDQSDMLLLGGFHKNFDFFFVDNNLSIVVKGSENPDGSVWPLNMTQIVPAMILQLYKRLNKKKFID